MRTVGGQDKRRGLLLGVAAAWVAVGAVVHPGLLQSLPWHLALAAWIWAWGSARQSSALRALGIAGFTVWLVLATPAGANALLRRVEEPVQPVTCSRDADRTHVLLAGGLSRPPRDDRDVFALSEASLLRAGRWLQQFGADDKRTLVISGGGTHGEARLIGELLRRMGRLEGRMLLEDRSRNTADSAAVLADPPDAMSGAGRDIERRRIVLSTSALHQARATALFRSRGFDVCANPLYSDYLPPGSLGYYWPQTSSMRKAEAALHELAGLWWVRTGLDRQLAQLRVVLARP